MFIPSPLKFNQNHATTTPSKTARPLQQNTAPSNSGVATTPLPPPAHLANLVATSRRSAPLDGKEDRLRPRSEGIPRKLPGFEMIGAKPEKTLVFLGTGQTGMAGQRGLLDLLASQDLYATPLRIHVASEHASVGPAYTAKNDHRLLNTPANGMTFGDDALPFHEWARQNEEQLSSKGLLEKNEAGYADSNLRRVVYGLYLLDRRPDIFDQLAQRSLEFRFHPNDPAVTAWVEGDKTHVALRSGEEIAADAVLDAIGGYERKVKDALDDHPAVKAGHVRHISTYDSEQLRQIPDGSDVFFRGFRLGALDHFEQGGLIDRLTGTGGTVTFSSRTGGMSPVSGKKFTFEPEEFTLDALDGLLSQGKLNAASLKDLIQRETDKQCDQRGMARFDIDACKAPFQHRPASPDDFTRETLDKLEKDIAAARGGPMTPSVLLSSVYGSIYPVVRKMFNAGMVPPQEHKACHQVTTWPAQVPVQIAEKMLSLGNERKVRIFAGVEQDAGSGSDGTEVVFTSSYRGADGETKSHTHSPKYIVDATGGFNDIIQDLEASGGTFRNNAVENGVYRAYKGKNENREDIALGGIDYDTRTQLAAGLGNVGVAGSITAGKDKLPPSGTAKKLAQDARVAVASAIWAPGQGARAIHSSALLQREEVFEHSDRLFQKLPGLLASEELRRDGKIERDSLRLLLPDRKPGEAIFSIEESVQFACFTGISRPQAGEKIGKLDDHIVWQMVPKEKSTPLCYLSEKVQDDRGNEFWVNIVLWKERQMGPTEANAPKGRERWKPDAKAKHLNTVLYALYGTPKPIQKNLPPFSAKAFSEPAEPPAFMEVHFMNGPIDAHNVRLKFEEHRLSQTQVRAANGELIPGEKIVSRLKTPKGLPETDPQRWVTVTHDQLKDPRRSRPVDGTATDPAARYAISQSLARERPSANLDGPLPEDVD